MHINFKTLFLAYFNIHFVEWPRII